MGEETVDTYTPFPAVHASRRTLQRVFSLSRSFLSPLFPTPSILLPNERALFDQIKDGDSASSLPNVVAYITYAASAGGHLLAIAVHSAHSYSLSRCSPISRQLPPPPHSPRSRIPEIRSIRSGIYIRSLNATSRNVVLRTITRAG